MIHQIFQVPPTPVVSTVTSAAQRSTTWRWISGTLGKIAKTSAWRTWSIGCGPRPSSPKVELLAFRKQPVAVVIAGGEMVTSCSSSGGFAQSELMSGHLVDFFVPFLPLEYRHVKLCARDAYVARGLEPDEATLDEVAKAMLYVPKEERLFSAQGCKSIPQRINFFLP